LTHKDARVHCVVLNIRAEPHHTHPPAPPKQQGRPVQATGEARTEETELASEPSGPNNVPSTTHPPAHVPDNPPKESSCTSRANHVRGAN